MSSYAIDYFATLGRRPGELSCKSMPSATSESTVPPSEIWLDAITDITVIYFDDEASIPVDDECGSPPIVSTDGVDWELVKYTVDGDLANCNPGDPSRGISLLAVRRRRQSKRLDHICEIIVLHRGDSVPDGYEVLSKSLSCDRVTDMFPYASTRLAIRRAETGGSAFIHGQPLIDDIVLADLTMGEEAPREYEVIDKPLSPKMGGSGTQHPHKVVVSYHRRTPLGLCDMQYEAYTLDRYPQHDHDGLALPVVELPMFVFPHDLRLKYSPKLNFPIPDFFTFVFTDVKGRHLYTTCLRFYELLDKAEVAAVLSEVFGSEHSLSCEEGMEFFAPKVICVVSQFPFYRAMGRYLKQLYSLSLSPSHCPLEHFIASVVAQVPLPVPGGRPFHVVLDAALISESSRAMAPICFDLPSRYFLPPMDLDFAGPMRCLSAEHLLAVFCLLLRESKVAFVCSSNALLTEVMETFRSLLFPLTWSSCFITRLPDSLSGVLQAPGGFMIGMHIADKMSDNNTTDRDSEHSLPSGTGQGIPRSVIGTALMHSLQPGTYIVDLTENKIRYHDGVRAEPLSASKVQQLVKMLPSGPGRKLHSKLQIIAKKFLLCPQKFDSFGLAEFDSAFEYKSFEGDSLPAGRKWSDFPTFWVRDAFLSFMCDLLGDVSKYIRPPVPSVPGNCFSRSFAEQFMIEEYIRDADKSVKPLLKAMMDTQMFAYLIQERTEDPSFPLVFFDQALNTLKELGLSALPTDRRLPQSLATATKAPVTGYDIDMDTPLLEHVEKLALLSTAFPSSRNVVPTQVDEHLQRRRMNLMTASSSSVGTLSDSVSTNGMPTTHTNSKLSLGNRSELRSHVDLHLDDKSKGALIIPGPLREKEEDEDSDDEVKFRYQSGWPNLDATLLDGVEEDIVKKGLHDLKQLRERSIEHVDPRCQFFVRPPILRLCYQDSGCLVRKVNMNLYTESKAATGMVMDLFSTSLLMLSLRSSRKVNSIGSVLQAFGVLAHLDSLKLLSLVDDTIWRGLLVACGAIEEQDFSHKATCIVYSTMKSAGIDPDVLSYGIYCKSFSRMSKKGVSSAVARETYWDPYFHLEQIGLSWYSQKSIPFDDDIESITDSPSGSTPSTPVRTSGASSAQLTPQSVSPSPPRSVPGSLWGMLRGKKKASMELIGPRARRMSVNASTASIDLAKVLGLDRSSSPFSMRKPHRYESLPTAVRVLELAHESADTWEPVRYSDSLITERVGELRELYNRVRSQESSDKILTVLPVGEKDHAKTVVAAPIKGKLEVAAVAVKGLQLPKDGVEGVFTRNIYVRVWLSSDDSLRLKTQPGVKIVKDSYNSDLHLLEELEYVTFYSFISSSTTLTVEAFGDFSRDREGGCFAFDQSLGMGSMALDGNPIDLSKHWITLKNSTSDSELDLLLVLRLSFSGPDEGSAIKKQNTRDSLDVEPRTPATKDADLIYQPLTSDLFDGPNKVAESSKAGWDWKSKLSFGLYKPRVLKSESIESSRSLTPPPRAIAELIDERDRLPVTVQDSGEFSDSEEGEATQSDSAASDSPAISSGKLDSLTPSLRTLPSESSQNQPQVISAQNTDTSSKSSGELPLFDDDEKKKSSRWRKSFALLTGESEQSTYDDNTIDSSERSKHGSSIGMRIRRRISRENVSNVSTDSNGGEVFSPPSPGTPKASKRRSIKGMLSATRRRMSSRSDADLPEQQPQHVDNGSCSPDDKVNAEYYSTDPNDEVGSTLKACTDEVVDDGVSLHIDEHEQVDKTITDCISPVDSAELRSEKGKDEVAPGRRESVTSHPLLFNSPNGKKQENESDDSESSESIQQSYDDSAIIETCQEVPSAEIARHGTRQEVPSAENAQDDDASATCSSDIEKNHISTIPEEFNRDKVKEGSISSEASCILGMDTEKQYADHIVELQSRLLNGVPPDTGLGMFSASPCELCGFVLLDDEVMAAWAGFSEIGSCMTENILVAHEITCPECGGNIVPILHVKQYRVISSGKRLESGEVPPEEPVEVIWEQMVQHISPFGLRFMFEHIVEEHGMMVTDAQWLYETCPTAYWNLLWYSSRFHLPAGIFIQGHSIDLVDSLGDAGVSLPWAGPLAVGWRECTVVSRVKRLVHGESVGLPLPAADVFPGATEGDIRSAAEIVAGIDGSLTSIASGLTQISSLSSILTCFSGTLARQLYLSYLFLVHQFNSDLTQYSTELPSGLSKGSVFDRAFIETISIAFSPSDFSRLSVTDAALNRASSNRAAQAIRIAFGLLY